ncbi:hypothetical protein [Oryzisolibacter sp. LB2S]|uniref:hypothetical protein n=1 Tax=Alicycliphilus soli TaxID=3228789 RepID=UPI003458CA20
MRYVIQSAFTGAFLAPNPDDGQPEWVMLLRDACAVDDLETCAQLIEDHCDSYHKAVVVDLRCLYKNPQVE